MRAKAAEGWISLHRRVQEHWVWNGEPACRGRAWTDLLLLAAYEPHGVSIKGELITVERGDLVASVRFLARRWSWSLKKTASFLRRLDVDHMLVRKRHGSGNGSPSIFHVENYATYQPGTAPKRDGFGNAQETLRRRLGDETNKGKKGQKETEAAASGPHRAVLDTYHRLFTEKVGSPPHIVGGRDGKIVRELLRGRQAEQVLALLHGFFRTGTRWTREQGRYDLPAFKASFNDLLVMQSRGEL